MNHLRPKEKPVMDFNIMDLDVQEELIDDDDMMPKVQEKEKINVKDIFDNINEEALRDEETGEVNPNFIYSEKPHRQDRKLAKLAEGNIRKETKETNVRGT
jgi:hypothetical protein